VLPGLHAVCGGCLWWCLSVECLEWHACSTLYGACSLCDAYCAHADLRCCWVQDAARGASRLAVDKPAAVKAGDWIRIGQGRNGSADVSQASRPLGLSWGSVCRHLLPPPPACATACLRHGCSCSDTAWQVHARVIPTHHRSPNSPISPQPSLPLLQQGISNGVSTWAPTAAEFGSNTFAFSAKVAAVEGSALVLERPLPAPVRTAWAAAVYPGTTSWRAVSGVEYLTLEFAFTPYRGVGKVSCLGVPRPTRGWAR